MKIDGSGWTLEDGSWIGNNGGYLEVMDSDGAPVFVRVARHGLDDDQTPALLLLKWLQEDAQTWSLTSEGEIGALDPDADEAALIDRLHTSIAAARWACAHQMELGRHAAGFVD
jgi:hypothetical protein